MFKVLFFTLTCFLTVSCSEKLVNGTPEEFGKSVVTAINNRDFDEFKKYIVSLDNFTEIIEKTEYKSKSDKEKVLSTLEDRFNGLIDENKTDFNNLRIDSLQYSKCNDYTISTDGDIEYIRGYYIITKSGETSKEIGFLVLINTKDGWKSMGSFKLK